MGMEMTFEIDPALMARVRDVAARRGISVSDLVAAGLARVLEAEAPEKDEPLRPLPTWHGGEFLVDIANRDELDPGMCQRGGETPLPPLPTWNSGGFLVDVADRKALYALLDGE